MAERQIAFETSEWVLTIHFSEPIPRWTPLESLFHQGHLISSVKANRRDNLQRGRA